MCLHRQLSWISKQLSLSVVALPNCVAANKSGCSYRVSLSSLGYFRWGAWRPDPWTGCAVQSTSGWEPANPGREQLPLSLRLGPVAGGLDNETTDVVFPRLLERSRCLSRPHAKAGTLLRVSTGFMEWPSASRIAPAGKVCHDRTGRTASHLPHLSGRSSVRQLRKHCMGAIGAF